MLGLGHDAQVSDIASAYRRSALASNPESNKDHPDPIALQKTFKLVSQAYTVLADPQTRGIYDLYGEDGVRHGGTGTVGVPGGVDVDAIDPDVVFRRFFGVDNPFQVLDEISGVQNNQHHFFSVTAAKDMNPPKTAPVNVELQVLIEDVFHGSSRRVNWTITDSTARGEVTATSPGTFEVTVPKGIQAGNQIILRGKGNRQDGFSQGDVIVTVLIAPHDRFTRSGDDLVVVVPITLVDALCGTNVVVKTIEGRDLPLQIDEIVHPNFKRIIPSEGLPVYQQPGKRGNLVVTCTTEFPRYLSAEQKSEVRRILESDQ